MKSDINEKRAEFFLTWSTRFRSWKGVVTRDEMAKALDLNPATVSALTAGDRHDYTIPEPHLQIEAARLMNASPCWLAFGLGARDPVAAKKAAELSEKFEGVPGLAHISEAYVSASPKDQEMMRLMAEKFTPAPAIAATAPIAEDEKELLARYRALKESERKDLLERVRSRGDFDSVIVDHDMQILAIEAKPFSSTLEPAHVFSEQNKDQPLRLPPAEYEAVMKWLLPQISTMKKGLPVPKGLRKIAKRLAYDNSPEGLARKQDRASRETDTPEKAPPTSKSPRRRQALPEKAPAKPRA